MNTAAPLATRIPDTVPQPIPAFELGSRAPESWQIAADLASGLSHDLINLLTVVQGHTALLLCRPDLSEDIRHSLQEINCAGERMAEVLHRLSLFSPEQIIQPIPIQLETWLQRLLPGLKRAAGDSIKVILDPMPDLPRVAIDQDLLEAGLLSLARFVRRSAGHDSTWTISGHLASESTTGALSSTTGTLAVTLAFSDNGQGIKQESLPFLFTPYQYRRSDIPKTGLDLATLYAVVCQHRGRLVVRSEPGIGTTFEIVLPIDDAAR